MVLGVQTSLIALFALLLLSVHSSASKSEYSVPEYEFLKERLPSEAASEKNVTCWSQGIHMAVMRGDFRCLRQLIGDFRDYSGEDEDEADFDDIDRALRYLRTQGSSFIPRGVGESQREEMQWRGGISMQLHKLDSFSNNVAKLAIESNQTQTLAYAILLGVNASVQNVHGQNAIHSAAALGCGKCLDIINEFGHLKAAAYNMEDKDGMSPLHWAAARDHSVAIHRIAAVGADVNKGAAYGKGPLQYACALGHARSVESLLKFGASANATDSYGRDCFLECTLTACVSWLTCGFIDHPTQLSIYEGPPKLIEMLASLGVDINKKDIFNNTALSLASMRGDEEIIRMLLSLGAQADIVNADGESPIHLTTKSGTIQALRAFLSIPEAAQYINLKDSLGWTPLHWASLLGRRDAVRLLLDGGAARNMRTDRNETALHAAASRGLVDVAEELCFDGNGNGEGSRERVSCDLMAVSDLGETVLHVAAANGSASFITFVHDSLKNLSLSTAGGENLVRSIATMKDNRRYTPLHTAILYGNFHAAVALLSLFPINPRVKSRGGPIACGIDHKCTPLMLAKATEGSGNMTFMLYSFLNPFRGMFLGEEYDTWGSYEAAHARLQQSSSKESADTEVEEGITFDESEWEEEEEDFNVEAAFPPSHKFVSSAKLPCSRSRRHKAIEKWTGGDVSQWLRCLGLDRAPCSMDMDCNTALRRHHVNGKKLLRIARLKAPSYYKEQKDSQHSRKRVSQKEESRRKEIDAVRQNRQANITGSDSEIATEETLCSSFHKNFEMPNSCPFCDYASSNLESGKMAYVIADFDFDTAMRNLFEIGVHPATYRRAILHGILSAFDYRFEYWKFIEACHAASEATAE